MLAQLRATLESSRKQGLERLFVIESEYEIAMREAERTCVAALVKLIRISPDFTRTWKAFHRRRGRPGPKAATVTGRASRAKAVGGRRRDDR